MLYLVVRQQTEQDANERRRIRKMRATITIQLAHPLKDNRAEVIHALGSSPWKVGDSEVINARFNRPAGNWRRKIYETHRGIRFNGSP
jgi:hypothetical protein